jgi:membrane-bound lytic murein transglycosylase F
MRALATLFALLALLSGCQEPVKKLLPVEQGRELVVVTHNGPATYYVTSQNEYAGLEYDLARLFAQSLGEDVKLRILLVDNVTAVIPTLLKGRAHLAAANLTITPLRQHLVRFGPPYQTVRQQVIYNRDSGKAPRTLRDLAGKSLTVPAGTSYAERLREAAAKEPSLHWREAEQANSDELLEQVATGTLDLTIVDSPLAAMKKNLYPNLGIAFDFGPAD